MNQVFKSVMITISVALIVLFSVYIMHKTKKTETAIVRSQQEYRDSLTRRQWNVESAILLNDNIRWHNELWFKQGVKFNYIPWANEKNWREVKELFDKECERVENLKATMGVDELERIYNPQKQKILKKIY